MFNIPVNFNKTSCMPMEDPLATEDCVVAGSWAVGTLTEATLTEAVEFSCVAGVTFLRFLPALLCRFLLVRSGACGAGVFDTGTFGEELISWSVSCSEVAGDGGIVLMALRLWIRLPFPFGRGHGDVLGVVGDCGIVDQRGKDGAEPRMPGIKFDGVKRFGMTKVEMKSRRAVESCPD